MGSCFSKWIHLIASGDSCAVRFRKCVHLPAVRFSNDSSLSYGFDIISSCDNDDAISAGMLFSATDGASRPFPDSYDQDLIKLIKHGQMKAHTFRNIGLICKGILE